MGENTVDVVGARVVEGVGNGGWTEGETSSGGRINWLRGERKAYSDGRIVWERVLTR